jgi:hypothetical protein
VSANVSDIEHAVYTALAADTATNGVSTLVSGRISEADGVQDETPPRVSYSVTLRAFPNMTRDNYEADVLVDCYDYKAKGIDSVRVIADRVVDALKSGSIPVTNFSRLSFMEATPGTGEIQDNAIAHVSTTIKLFASGN